MTTQGGSEHRKPTRVLDEAAEKLIAAWISNDMKKAHGQARVVLDNFLDDPALAYDYHNAYEHNHLRDGRRIATFYGVAVRKDDTGARLETFVTRPETQYDLILRDESKVLDWIWKLSSKSVPMTFDPAKRAEHTTDFLRFLRQR